jgi:hypothetical protein
MITKESPKPVSKSRTIQSIAFGAILLLLTLILRRTDLPDYLAFVKYPETLEYVSGVIVLVLARLFRLKLDDNKKVAVLIGKLLESKTEKVKKESKGDNR